MTLTFHDAKQTVKTFKVDDTYRSAGRGTMYCGLAPFEFERSESLAAFDGPWLIDHPDTAGVIFRIIGVESNCIPTIRAGSTICLMVEPWEPNAEFTGANRRPVE